MPLPAGGLRFKHDRSKAGTRVHDSLGGKAPDGRPHDNGAYACRRRDFRERRQQVSFCVTPLGDGAAEAIDELPREGQAAAAVDLEGEGRHVSC